MKKIDTSLEARQLKLFLSLIETGSLTDTAEALGIGQSAVSHALKKLRIELEDPLFVRSGRGIKATPHALSIVDRVHEVLLMMGTLAVKAVFDPASANGEIVIGANEYQRDLLLPGLFGIFRVQAPGLRLRVISNPYEPLDLIREGDVDLVLTPTPPDKSDIHTLRLNDDRQAIFYDASRRKAPRTKEDFLRADYVVPEVIYDTQTGYIRRLFSPVKGRDIRPKIVLNTFAGVPKFLRGSDLLSPLPEKLPFMSAFSSCHVPGTYHPLSIHLCWHERNHQSPLHQWLIQQLQKNLGYG